MTGDQRGEMSGEASGPDGEALQEELAENVVEPRDLPAGYRGPGITIISEDEDEPDNRWSERPR